MNGLTLNLDVGELATAIAAALPEHVRMPELISLQSVAELLDCSTEHVRSLVAGGHLVAVDIAEDPTKRAALRVTRASLAAFTQARRLP
jgi:hypothetical protein